MLSSRLVFLLLQLFLVGLALSAGACQSAYYRTMEAFGQDKRELLVDYVGDARDSQEEAKEQFQSALEEFSALVGFDGGELEALYDQLNRAFERSEDRAEKVRSEIDDVEDVSEALFEEWEDELGDYSDRDLRQASERQLAETRAQYEELIAAMHRAEDKMDPVLNAFRDQVLFLKHNLNARAIASLEGTVATLQSDISALIADMESSIVEANRFIEQMQSG